MNCQAWKDLSTCAMFSVLLLVYHSASQEQPADKIPGALWTVSGTSLEHPPECHSTLSARPLCWEIVANSFLPANSEPMYSQNPVCDASLGRGHLGSTGRGDSPCLVPQNCSVRLHPLPCGQHQAGKCLKSSELVQLKTRSRKNKHVFRLTPHKGGPKDAPGTSKSDFHWPNAV